MRTRMNSWVIKNLPLRRPLRRPYNLYDIKGEFKKARELTLVIIVLIFPKYRKFGLKTEFLKFLSIQPSCCNMVDKYHGIRLQH